jgi:hypothetical protein
MILLDLTLSKLTYIESEITVQAVPSHEFNRLPSQGFSRIESKAALHVPTHSLTATLRVPSVT